MHFNKPALKINQQIELLKSRGLIINNYKLAEEILANISYYRLGAYMIPFQQENDQNHSFVGEVTLENILNLYEFDRSLRIIVFNAIERLEIAIRTQIIYEFSISKGSHWFEDDKLFNNKKFFENNLQQLDKEIDRSLEVFIGHYKNKYNFPARPPAWMSLEVSSLGLISKIYKNIYPSKEKKNIADHFGLNYKVLESWTEVLSYVRNICAHHSSLWNRILTLTPLNPTHPHFEWLKNTSIAQNKIYMLLSCVNYLLQRVKLDSSFNVELKSLIVKNPNLDVSKMGFASDWLDEPIWK